MAFHEAFWVVSGTAAPVLLLAHVVSLRQAGNRWAAWGDEIGASRTRLVAEHGRISGGLIWIGSSVLDPIVVLSMVGFIAQGTPFVIDAILFIWSLDALNAQHASHTAGTVELLFIIVIAIQGAQHLFGGMIDVFNQGSNRKRVPDDAAW